MSQKTFALNFHHNPRYSRNFVSIRMIDGVKTAYILSDDSEAPASEKEIWLVESAGKLGLCGGQQIEKVRLLKKLPLALGEQTSFSYKPANNKGPSHSMKVDDGYRLIAVPDRRGLMPDNFDTRWNGAVQQVIFSNQYLTIVSVLLKEEVLSARARRRRERKKAA